jgi:hypothetical protein
VPSITAWQLHDGVSRIVGEAKAADELSHPFPTVIVPSHLVD